MKHPHNNHLNGAMRKTIKINNSKVTSIENVLMDNSLLSGVNIHIIEINFNVTDSIIMAMEANSEMSKMSHGEGLIQ